MAGTSPAMTEYFAVIAGLDPAIHPAKKMDARIKSAHDTGASYEQQGR
jgi:hypothetical protein